MKTPGKDESHEAAVEAEALPAGGASPSFVALFRSESQPAGEFERAPGLIDSLQEMRRASAVVHGGDWIRLVAVEDIAHA